MTVPKFELRSGEAWRNPFDMYAALRDRDPVHHVADRDFYVLTRFADLWAAAGDPATFSSAKALTVNYGEDIRSFVVERLDRIRELGSAAIPESPLHSADD